MSKSKLNITIDEELKIQLKIKAVQEKKTVSDIIADLVQKYLKDDG